jgi:hypothetical protein
MSLTVKRDAMAKLMKSLHALTGRDVLVGVPTTRADRKEKGEPVNNAEIGYWQEFGAPAANIPARPHLIPGVEAAADDINKQFRAAAVAALRGEAHEVDRRMNAAGLLAQNSVRRLIGDGLVPELAARTLAARRARGRTGEKPLIDTGQYRNSITYVIRRK